eukprot:gnl/MRDRNA2_/MRDRNA2_30867_c0_seq1.p1 gnl/MRDRNA2_/MRDRNA2_30867_c0~~gnl/MRDRNA2_/MRDRNA2_30867_c0_seq1.p1  ORF type:complete len:547 (+),score=114.09 gnl/MRDRNA2_/MRDRNA2_30867_c0_seq1:113-1642(+)
MASSRRVNGMLYHGMPGESSDRSVQSPHANASAVPDGDFSDFEVAGSWQDDASSQQTSLAGGTVNEGDRLVTVNTQRARMGDHLRTKLQGMIRQRFENFLRISLTQQNETGKLVGLECELAIRSRDSGAALPRIGIQCDESFLVYILEGGSGGSPSAAGSGCARPPSEEPEENALGEALQKWVEKVSSYGSSGQCQSLTALFHFGYTTWKQMPRDMLLSRWDLDGEAAGQIAEEDYDERPYGSPQEPEPLQPLPLPEMNVAVALSEAVAQEEDPSPEPPAVETEAPCHVLSTSKSAQRAVEEGNQTEAVELCTLGISMVREHPMLFHHGVEGDEQRNALQGLLLLRSAAEAQIGALASALCDAEEVIQLQPTCAEAYYRQAVAQKAMGRDKEALESLMSALEYDPQNSEFQQAFTVLFEEISASQVQTPAPPVSGPSGASVAASGPIRGFRRGSSGAAGDALSTTTQATRLSSRSTTPTEVSAPLSRSSSCDSPFPEQPAASSEDPVNL